jgi:hypothetical protein
MDLVSDFWFESAIIDAQYKVFIKCNYKQALNGVYLSLFACF